MAQPLSPQIPHHVSALLSHLTSRPGVQSTLILSRKDGSIIQSTGLLAVNSTTSTTPLGAGSTIDTDSSTENAAAAATTSGSATNSTDITSSTPESPPPPSSTSAHASQNNHHQQYKPSQAETLAAHIHAFMSSASGLALSLSGGEDVRFESRSRNVNGTGVSGGDGSFTSTERPHDENTDRGYDREEDDEIKLLRLRTKKHEIVVVPDRKYLLCVVHDASGATPAATSSAGGGGISRQGD